MITRECRLTSRAAAALAPPLRFRSAMSYLVGAAVEVGPGGTNWRTPAMNRLRKPPFERLLSGKPMDADDWQLLAVSVKERYGTSTIFPTCCFDRNAI